MNKRERERERAWKKLDELSRVIVKNDEKAKNLFWSIGFGRTQPEKVYVWVLEYVKIQKKHCLPPKFDDFEDDDGGLIISVHNRIFFESLSLSKWLFRFFSHSKIKNDTKKKLANPRETIVSHFLLWWFRGVRRQN